MYKKYFILPLGGSGGGGTAVVVDELPAVEEAKANVIYMIVKEDAEEQDYYDEWMVVEKDGVKQWEKIGNTKIDLSDYYTKEEVDESYPIHIIPYIVNEKISEADYALIVKNPSKCMLKRINPDGSSAITYPKLIDVYYGQSSDGYEYCKNYSQNNHSYKLTCLVQFNRTVSESQTDMLLAKPSDIKDSTITIKQGDVEQSFTLNQSSDQTIELQQGGGGNEWFGTEEEFKALGEYDESGNTLYHIEGQIDYKTDIKNLPIIAKKVSQLPNDAHYVQDVKKINGISMRGKGDIDIMKIIERYHWWGTQEEYDAIETKDPNVQYHIEGNTTTLTFEMEDGTTQNFKVINE